MNESSTEPEATEISPEEVGGVNLKIALTALGVGSLLLALQLSEWFLNSLWIRAFPFEPSFAVDAILTAWSPAVLGDLIPFLIIFAVAARMKLNPLEEGTPLLFILFVAGVLIGILSFVIEFKILTPLVYLQSSSAAPSLASQMLTPSFAESMLESGLSLLFLGLSALAMGYFWSENPLWRPMAWLRAENHDDDRDEGRDADLEAPDAMPDGGQEQG